jgi:hypothetical protein
MTNSPITVEQFPWSAQWSGGRLMDIRHAEGTSALDCVQVGDYDWQKGQLAEEITEAKLRERLAEWVEEQGGTFERELPYL